MSRQDAPGFAPIHLVPVHLADLVKRDTEVYRQQRAAGKTKLADSNITQGPRL